MKGSEKIVKDIVNIVKKKGLVTADEMKKIIKSLAKKYKLSERSIYSYLRKAIKEGKINKIGNKRGAIYSISTKANLAKEKKIEKVIKTYSHLLKYDPRKVLKAFQKGKVYPQLFSLLYYLYNHYRRVSDEQKRIIREALKRMGWDISIVKYIIEKYEFDRRYKVISADEIGTKIKLRKRRY